MGVFAFIYMTAVSEGELIMASLASQQIACAFPGQILS
jgi:hypothetical protein